MVREIPFYIESPNGHDEKLVPEDKVQEEIKEHLKDGNWAAVQTTNNEHKLVTPPVENKEEDWKKAFATVPKKEEVKQVSVTKPMKGA